MAAKGLRDAVADAARAADHERGFARKIQFAHLSLLIACVHHSTADWHGRDGGARAKRAAHDHRRRPLPHASLARRSRRGGADAARARRGSRRRGRALRRRRHAGYGGADRRRPTQAIRSRVNSCPRQRSSMHAPNELADPIGDKKHSPVAGIVHRYRDRVLLKIVNHCAVYCRFCFRREMVGPQSAPALSPDELESALAYIAAHREIWEVILTGGDPFMLSPRRAADLMARLGAIDHVKIIRWHTRVPVVDPDRVTPDFVRAIKAPGKATYVALHANHPRELTPAARQACARLVDAGVVMVSQSVLLKGVNDDADTLEALMRAFVEARVKPYYLHHADLGAWHRTLPHDDRRRPSADARTQAPRLRPRATRVCSRHPRRLFKGRSRRARYRARLKLLSRPRRRRSTGTTIPARNSPAA